MMNKFLYANFVIWIFVFIDISLISSQFLMPLYNPLLFYPYMYVHLYNY